MITVPAETLVFLTKSVKIKIGFFSLEKQYEKRLCEHNEI